MGFRGWTAREALIRLVVLVILSAPATALRANSANMEKPRRGSELCFTPGKEEYTLLCCYERPGSATRGEVFGNENTYITLVSVYNMSTAVYLEGCAMAARRNTRNGDHAYVAVSQGRHAVSEPRNARDGVLTGAGPLSLRYEPCGAGAEGRLEPCVIPRALGIRKYRVVAALSMRSSTLSATGSGRTRLVRAGNIPRGASTDAIEASPHRPCHAQHKERSPL